MNPDLSSQKNLVQIHFVREIAVVTLSTDTIHFDLGYPGRSKKPRA